jgi:hypothetical protein
VKVAKPDPKIDPGTTGISFVDILFALVVGQVLDPLRLWAADPRAHPLSTAVLMHLGVALTVTLASWVGYHGSANRPRFRLRFFNLELAKFGLDIAMVIVYFLMASYAVRTPISVRPETLLVTVAFGLYLLWDLAGAWEKAGDENPYKAAWDAAYDSDERPDVHEPWIPKSWPRIWATIVSLSAALVIWIAAWLTFPQHHVPTWKASVALDGLLIVLLVAYRFAKDQLGQASVGN